MGRALSMLHARPGRQHRARAGPGWHRARNGGHPSMRTRKLLGLLAGLATTAAATAVVATFGAPAAHAVGPAILPVTVTNSTGRGDAVYLYVLGVNLSTGRLGYVNSAGAFTNWSGGTVPPSPAPDV